MADTAQLQSATAYESATELREAHARLLEALDRELGEEASAQAEAEALARLEPRVLEFLQRGAATGVYLEETKERTACQTLLDYWASSLSQAGRPAPAARLARFDAEQLPDLKDKGCPYMGLDAFRDKTYFFGREADTQVLLAQLRQSPLVIVLGASGSGKSSLVIGGLLPAAAADAELGKLCALPPIVPGTRAMARLALALEECPGAAQGGAAQPLLVTLDQFEEVFTLTDDAEREALAAKLAELLGAGRGHRVVLTVREEFRSRIVGLDALGPYLDKAWYSMRPMGYAELRAAVEKPAAMVNLQFQSGIVDDLVKKVLGQPAALPLLQFTLRALWDRRDRNRITQEVYDRVGDPLKALTASADAFYDGLALQTQNEVKRILLELVRVDELLEAYRQPVPMSRLLQAGSASTEAVVGLLAANDYVRISATAGDTDSVVEVKHESLVRNWQRFVTWIDEKRHQRRGRLALSQAAERWSQSGKPQDGLLTGWQLEAAGSAPDLTDLEKEFVQASTEAIDRVRREKEEALRREARESRATARRFRTLWIATGVMALIAVYATWSAYQDSQAKLRAEAASREAEAASREKVLLAMKLQPLKYVDDQLDLALLLGVEANRLAEDEPELRQGLLSALGANLELVSLISGHTDVVRTVAFSPDGNTIASGSYDTTVILWDRGGRMLHAPLRGHTGNILRVAFGPDGRLVASASMDRTARLWDVATGKQVVQFAHPDEVYNVAIDRSGRFLATAGKDGQLRLWNIETRALEHAFVHSAAPAGSVERELFAMAFSPDGKVIVSGGLDGRIVLWDVAERRQLHVLEIEGRRGVWSMAVSRDGRTLATGTGDGNIDLWDLQKRAFLRRLGARHFGTGVVGMAFSADGQKLVTVGTDRNAYVHDIGGGKAEPMRLAGYSQAFYDVDVARDNMIVTGADNAMIALWHAARYHRFSEFLTGPQKGGGTRLAFGADRNSLVSFSEDQLQFWSVGANGKLWPSVVSARQGPIANLVSAPKSNLLATIGTNGSVNLWDIERRRRIKTLLGPGNEEVHSAALSADGRMLALGYKGVVRLWSLPEGAPAGTLSYNRQGKVVAVAFSPAQGRLASAMEGSGIVIWDLGGLRAVAESVFGKNARLDHQYVSSLAYSPDGSVLVSGGRESVGFWNGATGERLGRLIGYHPGEVLAVAVSPDGRMAASASSDRTVLFWDLRTRQPMGKPLAVHRSRAFSVAFSPDGTWLASSSQDGSISRWETDAQAWVARACNVVGRNFAGAEWKQFFGDQPPRVTCPGVKGMEADALALTGDREGAERAYAEAVRAALETKDPKASNSICWSGSVHRFAKLVLPACDRAVEFAPDGVAKGLYLDSRGLARALSGNTSGAIEDFTAAVALMKQFTEFRAEVRQLREGWIAALKGGQDPFDDALLRALRLE